MSNLDDDVSTIDAGTADTRVGDASGEHRGAYTRVVSDQTRALFAKAAAAVKSQLEEGEDDGPALGIETTPAEPAPAAVADAAPAATPEATPAAAPTSAAPAADDAVVLARTQLEAERAAFAAERAEWEARRATATADDVPDDPAAWVMERIKSWGAGTDEALRAELADLVTELSAKALGVPLNPATQAKLSQKRAERIVAQHNARLDKRERELAAKEEARQAAADKAEATRLLGAALTAKAEQFPFLNAEDDPAAIVYGIVEADHKRTGTTTSWEEAAARAEAAIKAKATAWHAKRAKMFQPAPADPQTSATKATATSPGGQALTNRAAAGGQAPPAVNDADLSNEERRARSMRRLAASLAERQAAE